MHVSLMPRAMQCTAMRCCPGSWVQCHYFPILCSIQSIAFHGWINHRWWLRGSWNISRGSLPRTGLIVVCMVIHQRHDPKLWLAGEMVRGLWSWKDGVGVLVFVMETLILHCRDDPGSGVAWRARTPYYRGFTLCTVTAVRWETVSHALCGVITIVLDISISVKWLVLAKAFAGPCQNRL